MCIFTFLKLTWWHSVLQAVELLQCLQETVWSNIHCWHESEQFGASMPCVFCSHPDHDLVACSTTVTFGSRFSWWQMFSSYSWWSWDNLLPESAILHCCKQIYLKPKDSHYLAPKVSSLGQLINWHKIKGQDHPFCQPQRSEKSCHRHIHSICSLADFTIKHYASATTIVSNGYEDGL